MPSWCTNAVPIRLPGREQEVVDGWFGAASVVEEIAAAGGQAASVAGDVCDPDTAQAILETATALGPLAAVVNNHGSAGEANAHVAHATPASLWDETIAVNVTSLHRLGAVLVPAC